MRRTIPTHPRGSPWPFASHFAIPDPGSGNTMVTLRRIHSYSTVLHPLTASTEVRPPGCNPGVLTSCVRPYPTGTSLSYSVNIAHCIYSVYTYVGMGRPQRYHVLYGDLTRDERLLLNAYALRNGTSKLRLVTAWCKRYISECLDHDRELGIEPPKIVE